MRCSNCIVVAVREIDHDLSCGDYVLHFITDFEIACIGVDLVIVNCCHIT